MNTPSIKGEGSVGFPEEHLHELSWKKKQKPLSFEPQQPLSFRQRVSDSERKQIKSFIESLSTDMKSEVNFLKEMLRLYSKNNHYPFDSNRALDEFTKIWIGLSVSRNAMLEQILNARERNVSRAIQRAIADQDLHLQFHNSESEEALKLGEKIWGSDMLRMEISKLLMNLKRTNRD